MPLTKHCRCCSAHTVNVYYCNHVCCCIRWCIVYTNALGDGQKSSCFDFRSRFQDCYPTPTDTQLRKNAVVSYSFINLDLCQILVKNYKIILQFIDSNYFYVSCRLSIRMFKLNFCINEINSLPRHWTIDMASIVDSYKVH